METIKNINYQGRIIPIEETAYSTFQVYENDLKNYFLKQEDGEDIFADLQIRMAEIFDTKLKKGAVAITLDDINDMKATIGNPSDFDEEHTKSNTDSTTTQNTTFTKEQKKLFRSSNDSIIAGVASGIANYFDLDATVVRLLFVLVTVMSGGIGLFIYILLWIVLTPKVLNTNLSRKLFRNRKDRVIAGVCSGLAEFFKIETWIVRLLFAAPLLFQMFTHDFHIGHMRIHFLDTSFPGIFILVYIVLAVVTKYAETSTDYMLLKGKPINLSTLNQGTISSITQTSSSAIRSILKIIAYFVLFILAISFLSSLIGITSISFISYQFLSSVLSTSLLKLLAFLSFIGLLLVPCVGLIIWLVRKIGNFKSPNNALRKMFGALGLLGLISVIFLIALLAKEFNAYSGSKSKLFINTQGNTLYIKSTDTNSIANETSFSLSGMNGIFREKNGKKEIKTVRLRFKESTDTSMYLQIEKGSCGTSIDNAKLKSNNIVFEPSFDQNNTLYIPSSIFLNAQEAFRGQHVKVTCFVPKNKKVVLSKALKHQLKNYLNFNNHGVFVNYNDEDDNEDNEDEIIDFNSDDDEWVIQVDDDKVNNKKEEMENKKELEKEAKEEIKDALREAEDKLEENKKELEQILKEKEERLKEAKDKIKEATDTNK